MSSFRSRGLIFLLLLLGALIAASAVLAPLRAKEPKAGVVSIWDNSVCGEPGEDPHLRTDVEIRIECTWMQGNSSGSRGTGEESRDPIDGYGMWERMDSTGLSRPMAKWRVYFRILILSIVTG